MDQLHTPERLENETMEAYRSRRRVGKLLAKMCRTIRPGDTNYGPSKVKDYRRQLVKAVGRRQATRYLKFRNALERMGQQPSGVPA